MDRLVDLEIVILREQRDSLVDGGVVENVVGHIVQGAWRATARCNYEDMSQSWMNRGNA